MIMPTIALYTIARKWAFALKDDPAIAAFCQDNYAKVPQIRLGLNAKKPPGAKDCPLIILRPGVKTEGEDVEVFEYVIGVGWAVVNEGALEIDGVQELTGIAEVDQFGQLILDCLSRVNSDHPISSYEYEIETVDFYPQFVGQMMVNLSIDPPIGAEIEY